MMRAALILVGVGLLVAMEVGTPPRVAKAVDQPLTQSTVGAGDPRDTLAKGRPARNSLLPKQLSTRLISFAEPMPPADSTSVISKEAGQIVGGNRHDAKSDTKSDANSDAKTKKVASYIPSQGPRSQIPNQGPRSGRDQAQDHGFQDASRIQIARSPPWMLSRVGQNAFDKFLKALKLPSGCEA